MTSLRASVQRSSGRRVARTEIPAARRCAYGGENLYPCTTPKSGTTLEVEREREDCVSFGRRRLPPYIRAGRRPLLVAGRCGTKPHTWPHQGAAPAPLGGPQMAHMASLPLAPLLGAHCPPWASYPGESHLRWAAPKNQIKYTPSVLKKDVISLSKFR